MGGHSFYAPSLSPIFTYCSMAILMGKEYPSLDTEDTLEGDAAHELAADMVSFAAKGVSRRWSSYDGGLASNGIPFNKDMFDAAKMFADEVLSTMRSCGNFNPSVEVQVKMPQIHPDMWGTPDVWLFDKVNGIIYIFDFKYGHKYVPPTTEQLLCYLAGALNELGLTGLQEQQVRASVCVVQPRSFHPSGPVRYKQYSAEDWRGMFNRIGSACHEADSNPTYNTGSHCQYCPGLVHCPAALMVAESSLDISMRDVAPHNLSSRGKGSLLKHINRAKEMLGFMETAIEADILSDFAKGINNPFWAKGYSNTRRKWIDQTKGDLKDIAELMGVRVTDPDKLLTPNQLIEQNPRLKEVTKQLVDEYSFKPRGSAILIPCNQDEEAKEVFGK